jgi:uncharacterized protein
MRRRAFVRLMAGATLAAALPAGARQGAHGHVLSAWAEGRGAARRYFAGRAAASAGAIELPARGHGVLRHPARSGVAYVCARRPGEYLLRFDAASGAVRARAEADEALRFEGHAVLDAPRNRLLATQSELDAGEGRIGIFDADSLERLGEWPTHGIGPHELAWAGTGVLAVANGGILTLPETGRIKRNLDTMEPSLVLLDARDGRRLAQYGLSERRLGIRHLALAADGALGAALQHEGSGAAPVLAVLRGGRLATAQAAPALERADGYGAAVAACGDRFAVTCPRGDCVLIWDSAGTRCGDVRIAKPAGIASAGDAWIVSNELGEIWRIDARRVEADRLAHAAGRAWDNHLAL